jgi:hypothetical protein
MESSNDEDEGLLGNAEEDNDTNIRSTSIY